MSRDTAPLLSPDAVDAAQSRVARVVEGLRLVIL